MEHRKADRFQAFWGVGLAAAIRRLFLKTSAYRVTVVPKVVLSKTKIILSHSFLESERTVLRLTLSLSFATHAGFVCAQELDGDKKALALRSNVVMIKATLGPGSAPQHGFGFVVGRQGNQAVVVTANHVVRDESDPDAVAKTPLITFYENQGVEIVGALQLSTSAVKSRGDIAVVLVPWPDRLSFVDRAQAGTPPARGDRVWAIGRGGGWNVPVNPGRISSQDPVDRHLEVEGLSVAAGSSGGPLVTEEGIVGMIVTDDPVALSVRATSIEVIEGLVRQQWKYDWSLVRVQKSQIPKKFSHATGYFAQDGEKWIEFPPHKYGHFSFAFQGVVDGYLYLADPTRVETGDPNRPFMLRIPVQGGMAQWSFPNPFVWKDLYVVTPGR